jgi:3-oxoacyl-[acyl-carrier-protein] synthase II
LILLVDTGASTQMAHRRVVVTGIGAVTPLGLTMESTWAALLNGESGIVSLVEAIGQHQDFLTDGQRDAELAACAKLSCQVAAPVKGFQSEDSSRTTSRFVQFALAAARDAMRHQHQDLLLPLDPLRTGVSIGSGMSSVREITQAVETANAQGFRKLSPHFVPKVLGNSAAGRVSMEYGFQGPNLTVATACAAGSHAIGDAYMCIRHGMADAMLAGGSEACIDPLSLAGFERLRALSTRWNDGPPRASRPFDNDRDGFVMGEGACILVLEELDAAIQRGHCGPLVEIIGYGATGDAHHITAPDPHGKGATRAMEMSCNGNAIDAVHYINAHATSTPKGDEIEVLAIQQATKRYGTNVYVSSTKGATGHLLGAAGAIESGFTVQTLLEQRIPHNRNLEIFTKAEGVTFVQHEPLSIESLEVAMNNSFGFGGTNASLLFRRISI